MTCTKRFFLGPTR